MRSLPDSIEEQPSTVLQFHGRYTTFAPHVYFAEDAVVVVAAIAVGALAPRAYGRVTLASASTFSGLVMSTLRSVEELRKVF